MGGPGPPGPSARDRARLGVVHSLAHAGLDRLGELDTILTTAAELDVRANDLSGGTIVVGAGIPYELVVVDPDDHTNDVGTCLMLWDGPDWIAAAEQELRAELAGTAYRTARRFRSIAFAALEVGPGALALVVRAPVLRSAVMCLGPWGRLGPQGGTLVVEKA